MFLLDVLKYKFWHWVVITLILFLFQMYLMIYLPGEVDLMCVERGYFTIQNILYAVILSLVLSLLFVSSFSIVRSSKSYGVFSFGISGVSAIFLTLTSFCTICTWPIVTLLGVSIGLSGFSIYNLEIKIVTLILVCLGLGLVEYRSKVGCKIT